MASQKSLISALRAYNEEVEPIFRKIFTEERKRVVKIAPFAGEMMDEYLHYVLRGKKLRGFEIILGYEMFGGTDKETALIASTVIEIVHSFFLMHDDVMDNDPIRRGEPTIHEKYGKVYGAHYGRSVAITLGDEGCFLAFRILNSLDLPAERIQKASRFLSEALFDVGLGEALDVTYEQLGRFKENDVLDIHRYKTAEYTIPAPITMGAILAGYEGKSLESIKQFGIPVGIAFQLRDDELGLFSTEEELGKPVDSDLRQGKVTLLYVKAMENAGEHEGIILDLAHGYKNLSLEQVEKVRSIVKKTGALEYSQKFSRKLVEEGKQFIPQITDDKYYQDMLVQLADFVIERNS